MKGPVVKFSIIIATYNRAALLKDTLDSLRQLQSQAAWEVLVVDNNSSDDTRAVVEGAAERFPVPLRYLFEPEQGRSAALNCGLRAAAGEILVTTDDDVRVEQDWLERIEVGLEAHQCDYVGGRVLPLWAGVVPPWLPSRFEVLCGVIAVMDYGPEPMKYGFRAPLGVNMAIRRAALDRVGEFDARIGRKSGTLLGQEVRDWCVRAHAAGVVGYYRPDIVVHHLIPPERLTKAYFRRWYYWRGVSRAMLYAHSGRDMEIPEQAAHDPASVRHIAGVPRYLFRTALVVLKDAAMARLSRDVEVSFDRELWLCNFAGIIHQRWRDRRLPLSRSPHHAASGAASVL
jgi:glycosyltransferase involved in cell wall biosynthesis